MTAAPVRQGLPGLRALLRTWTAVNPSGRHHLIALAAAGATSLSFTLATLLIERPAHAVELNPVAAGYLSVSPLALVAMKVVGMALCIFGLARAWPHVGRMLRWVMWPINVFCWIDAAWDVAQFILLLALPHLAR